MLERKLKTASMNANAVASGTNMKIKTRGRLDRRILKETDHSACTGQSHKRAPVGIDSMAYGFMTRKQERRGMEDAGNGGTSFDDSIEVYRFRIGH